MADRMTGLFLRFVNVSISACWIVVAALLFRLVFKKAPKWVNVVLWGIVALRLILPFSIESVLSIVPSAETVSPQIVYEAKPNITSGIAFVNSAINPVIESGFTPAPGASVNPLQIILPVLAAVWMCGAAAMLLYLVISWLRLKAKVKTAVLTEKGVYESECVTSPFVLGVFRPRIYIPTGVSERDKTVVCAHEKAHIKRFDNLIKPFSFILLALYWFNPAMWIAYIFLCRDVEFACDEKVIKGLGSEERAAYSETMLRFSAPQKLITACPLAFGEVGVKGRVKKVLSYKKPLLWIIIAAIATCAVLAVVLLTDPKKPSDIKTPETWPSLLEITDEYTPEQARRDGCVVIKQGAIFCNPDLLFEFDKKVENHTPAKMRICNFTITETVSSSVAVNDGKEPAVSVPVAKEVAIVFEIEYTGDEFILSYRVPAQGVTTEKFNYLISGITSYAASEDINICVYQLTNDEKLTQPKLFDLTSSIVTLDPRTITMFTVDTETGEPIFGSGSYDVDKDGREEKLLLVPKGSSDNAVFGIKAYYSGKLLYEGDCDAELSTLPVFVPDENGAPTVCVRDRETGNDVIFGVSVKNGKIVIGHNADRQDAPDLLKAVREYTEEQAENNGYVVVGTNGITAGENVFESFLEKTKNGVPASVRTIRIIKNDDNIVRDLSFDGQKYHVAFYEKEGGNYVLKKADYNYLLLCYNHNYFSSIPSSGIFLGYVLSDTKDADIDFSALLTWKTKDDNSVLLAYIYDYYKEAGNYFDRWLTDIDGDRKIEDVRLDMTVTGRFSFAINVYRYGEKQYHGIFFTNQYKNLCFRRVDGVIGVSADEEKREFDPATGEMIVTETVGHFMKIVIDGDKILLYENGEPVPTY